MRRQWDAGKRPGSPGGVAQPAVPDHIALVVSAGLFQGGVIGLDIPAQGLFLGEIHGGTGHRDLAAGGYAGVICFQIGVGIHTDPWKAL